MRRYYDDVNEEYERGYEAGRRAAMRNLDESDNEFYKSLPLGVKAKLNKRITGKEREKGQLKERKKRAEEALKIVSSFPFSSFNKLEKLLYRYSEFSNYEQELWDCFCKARDNLNTLHDELKGAPDHYQYIMDNPDEFL